LERYLQKAQNIRGLSEINSIEYEMDPRDAILGDETIHAHLCSLLRVEMP
jgi:hypothetical protein